MLAYAKLFEEFRSYLWESANNLFEYADLLPHGLYEVWLRPAQFQRRGFRLVSVPILHLHNSPKRSLAEGLLYRVLVFRCGLAPDKLVFIGNKVALFVCRDLPLLRL